ncbi:hypothetical protein Pcinc_008648 [Petrolisthes cinctipes]|uniref:Uncharacterized protein n=1 Tax=Petrolisthes cinctipes TaxID=88211 RepID=A0AAE1G8X2_PETCI|nr:hypothetical protein Pcinc_008648 [Petrolisthes cinctipes]
MSSRPRFRTATPRTPRNVGQQRHTHATAPWDHAGTQLLLQTLTDVNKHLKEWPQSSRVPSSATPEKCDVEMSTASFRSCRRSVECWVRLHR